jgi:hypothetical protein
VCERKLLFRKQTYLSVVERSVELVDADTEVAEHEEGGAQEHAPVTITACTPNLQRQRER